MKFARTFLSAFALLALTFGIVPHIVSAQYSPAPESQSSLDRWTERDGLTKTMNRNDPKSPVFHQGRTGPRYDVHSHQQAIENLANYTGTIFDGPILMEKLESWERFDGRDVRIGLAKTKIGGQTGDVLGATQQLSEAAALLTFAALLNT